MVVIICLWIGSDTSVISLYAFFVYILCILPPWRLPHGWLSHVGGHFVHNIILIYLCADVDSITVYKVMNFWATIKCGEFLNYLRSY
jgi:hypothetical protein